MKNFIYWLPVTAYAGLIFHISSIPGLDTPAPFPHFDKIFHLTEYLIFGVLLGMAWVKTKPRISLSRFVWLVGLCSFFYGITDEYHQSFVEGRSASILDLAADTVGGFLGGLILSPFVKRMHSK